VPSRGAHTQWPYPAHPSFKKQATKWSTPRSRMGQKKATSNHKKAARGAEGANLELPCVPFKLLAELGLLGLQLALYHARRRLCRESHVATRKRCMDDINPLRDSPSPNLVTTASSKTCGSGVDWRRVVARRRDEVEGGLQLNKNTISAHGNFKRR